MKLVFGGFGFTDVVVEVASVVAVTIEIRMVGFNWGFGASTILDG
jgi:hypothetical protein